MKVVAIHDPRHQRYDQRQHQQAIPLVKGFEGPLPDPRTEPFDARRRAFGNIGWVLILVALVAVWVLA